MIVAMTRTRMYFDTDEELKLAIQLEALKQDKSATELIEEVLREQFPDSIVEARKVIAQRKKKEAKG